MYVVVVLIDALTDKNVLFRKVADERPTTIRDSSRRDNDIGNVDITTEKNTGITDPRHNFTCLYLLIMPPAVKKRAISVAFPSVRPFLCLSDCLSVRHVHSE